MLCFLLGTTLASHAQKYNFTPFNLEIDLDISSISAIANSEKGYLYIADSETIYLFNGKSTEELINDFTLPFSEIKSLTEDPDGNLFLLSNNQLKTFGVDEPIIAESITTYLMDGDKVYFGNRSGVKVFDRTKNIIYRPDALLKLENIEINDLKIVGDLLYISSNRGLYRYDIKKESLDDFGLTASFDLQQINIDRKGNLWAYDPLGSLYKIDLKTKKLTPFRNEGFKISKVTIDSSDQIWIGTKDKGILRYNQEEDLWQTIDQKNGLPDNRVLEMMVDSWGVVWIATGDLTLSKFIDRDYEQYTVYDGMASDQVNAIFADSEEVYFSAGNKGVFKFIDGNFSQVHPLDVKCEAIMIDSTNLWIGTNGSGLIRINAAESTVFRKEAGLPSDWVNHISKANDGSIWLGSPSNGLAQLSQRDSLSMSILQFGEEEELKDEHITALHASSFGPVFYGTQSGQIGLINFENHRDLSSDMISSEVSDIQEGSKGEIYFSTLADGVFKIGSEKKGMMDSLAGYPKNVKALAFRDGKLWAVNDRGITDGTLTFSTSEGFPSSKVLAGGMVSAGGRNWIASMDGLIGIGELKEAQVNRSPKIHFNSIQINYSPVLFGRNSDQELTRIGYNDQVSFEYEGVDIHSSKDLSYSYMLEGQDKMWSPWTKNDNPSFNNLEAGNYTFKVMARSDEESISETISFDFPVAGPIWKNWWFYPSMVLGLGLLVFIIFRNRIRSIRKKNEEEKAQLELKNRLLELEQKANQLQMNPHFIFNALNSIQATVAKEDYKDARQEISDFATLMRSILANSKERVIALEDELKLLRKYIDIEKKCRTLGFEYSIEISDDIDVEEAQIPPMLIQPFVENAIVHGFTKDKGGKLLISFSLLEESVMQVSVIDDGVGYENSKASSVRKKHKSVAIEVTKERLETLLDKKYFPVLEIRQKDDDGGTIVDLKMPVEYEF